MERYLITDDSLSSIADAIREKRGNDIEEWLPSEMPEAIRGIEGGGGDLISVIQRTLTWYEDKAGEVTYLASSLFHEFNDLWGVSFPVCTSMNSTTGGLSRTFLSCPALRYVNFSVYSGVFFSGLFGTAAPLETVIFPECRSVSGSTLGQYYGETLRTVELWSASSGTFRDGCTVLENVSLLGYSSILSSAMFGACPALAVLDMPACTQISNGGLENHEALHTVRFSACSSIGSRAFSGCTALQTVMLPECVTVSTYAFLDCVALPAADFPKCETVGTEAFENCTAMTEMNLPACKTMGSRAFSGCTALKTAYLPVCETVGSGAFSGCTALEEVDFPLLSSIADATFSGCTALERVNIPECVTISRSAFYSCVKLGSVSFPKCETIGVRAFSDCTSLAAASFPACTNIGTSAFYHCSALEAFYLLGSGLAQLSDSTVFYYTPMSSSGYLGYFGSIYVPSSLYEAYIIASYWSGYSSRIVGVDPADYGM